MTFPPQDDIDRIMAVMERAFDPHWGEAWTRRQVEDSLRFAHTHYYLLPDEDGDGNRHADAFALVRSAPGEEEVLGNSDAGFLLPRPPLGRRTYLVTAMRPPWGGGSGR